MWLYGRPAAGKSTLAQGLEQRLHADGFVVRRLESDEIRQGLSRNLGFDETDRAEHIRRLAETARLFVDAGIVVVCAAITPFRSHRAMARSILGSDLQLVYVASSFETCAGRDPKGLYRRALRGEIVSFTGIDSPFEEPGNEGDLTIDTEGPSIGVSLENLAAAVVPNLTGGRRPPS